MAPRAPAYHHGDLRKALVEEAARLVETDGVDALTLRELARRLGVSHAAPAHHFADKAALLSELAADGYAELAAELEAGAARGRTPETRLREVGRGYLRFALRRPGHYRVMFGRELRTAVPSPKYEGAATRAYETLQSAVTRALPPARARSPERVREAAFLAWSVTHGAAMLLLDGPQVHDVPSTGDREAVKALVEHVTAAVAAAIAKGG
jgi:AcrR family transcriptional regulator